MQYGSPMVMEIRKGKMMNTVVGKMCNCLQITKMFIYFVKRRVIAGLHARNLNGKVNCSTDYTVRIG